MRKKTLTIDCGPCDLCSVDDTGTFQCAWGNGKVKKMFPAKGKKVIKCKLINKGKQ